MPEFPNKGGNQTIVSDHPPDVPGVRPGDRWEQHVNGVIVAWWTWDGEAWRQTQ